MFFTDSTLDPRTHRRNLLLPFTWAPARQARHRRADLYRLPDHIQRDIGLCDGIAPARYR